MTHSNQYKLTNKTSHNKDSNDAESRNIYK